MLHCFTFLCAFLIQDSSGGGMMDLWMDVEFRNYYKLMAPHHNSESIYRAASKTRDICGNDWKLVAVFTNVFLEAAWFERQTTVHWAASIQTSVAENQFCSSEAWRGFRRLAYMIMFRYICTSWIVVGNNALMHCAFFWPNSWLICSPFLLLDSKDTSTSY